MKSAMTAISLHLPGTLVRKSQKIASQLGVSRAEFIRMAIEHEITTWKKQQEIAKMLKAFKAMKKNKRYLKKANELMSSLNSELPDDEDEWWTKK